MFIILGEVGVKLSVNFKSTPNLKPSRFTLGLRPK